MSKDYIPEFPAKPTILFEPRHVRKSACFGVAVVVFVFIAETGLPAQDLNPYPQAITDRLIHARTDMPAPPVNVPFLDPDFGSQMIRVTDETSDFKRPGGYLRTEGSGTANVWSADTTKFYVIGQGGVPLAYSFDSATMKIGSLPGATPGQGLVLPLRADGSFSFTDSDVIYGATESNLLEISSYRFSTGVTSSVLDTTTCGMQPPLIPGPGVRNNGDITPSLDDSRISVSEGDPSLSNQMFVIVYDRNLGCRWYNTQTGQMGGQWGTTGTASTPDKFLAASAYLSRSGKYVRIAVNHSAWYVWDVATLQVTHCPLVSDLHCAGYTAMGYDSIVQARSLTDAFDIVKRPFDDISQVTPLVWPLAPPHYWGQDKRLTWSNVDVNDTAPVCGSTYYYDKEDDDTSITQPFEGEIFCLETDGIASTIWRFAHNRATYHEGYFHTQPLGSVSRDGRFFIFTSDWDDQLGLEPGGTPRSDVWIVKLD